LLISPRRLFYSGRRKYLATNNDRSNIKSVLDAPRDFKTRYQASEAIKVERESQLKQQLNNEEGAERRQSFHVKFASSGGKKEDTKSFQKVAKMIVTAITFENSAVNPNSKDHWHREEFGGVKMWVHNSTGEVSVDPPFLKDDFAQQNHRGSVKGGPIKRSVARRMSVISNKNKRRSMILPVSGYGTGSELYDPQETQELFDILDEIGKDKYFDIRHG
jgi:23S rRNA G2445 N2-methylase RlmL